MSAEGELGNHSDGARIWQEVSIYKQLEEIRPAMVLGVYTFGPKSNTVLMGIASLADACQTTLVGWCHPTGWVQFVRRQPDPDDWTEGSRRIRKLRSIAANAEAAHLGLAMPRFLLRQPYGKGSDAIESFPFEEMPANQIMNPTCGVIPPSFSGICLRMLLHLTVRRWMRVKEAAR